MKPKLTFDTVGQLEKLRAIAAITGGFHATTIPQAAPRAPAGMTKRLYRLPEAMRVRRPTMKQGGLTILSPIDNAKLANLNVYLRSIGDDVAKQTQIRFGDLTLLHFASWVIFEQGTSGPQLIFESNFDGSAACFLRQLTSKAHDGLDQIYRHCSDYPPGCDSNTLFEYLQARVVDTDTFYVSCGSITVARILQENLLHDKIEQFLAQLPSTKNRADIR
jgi:hypothetical protein